MKCTALALLGTVMLAAAPAAAQSTQEELLLLGLRNADGSLSTVLADRTGLRKVGDGIAVPRAKGWWKLDLLNRRQNSFEESILFAHDTTRPAREPTFQFDEGCESQTKELLLFVGPDHFSKEVSTNGYCQGSPHPWSYVQLATVSYDATVAAEPQPIDVLLGKGPTEDWKKAAEKARSAQKKRDRGCFDDARPEEWALVRQRGQWMLRGELNYLAEACRGKYEYFSVETALPTKLTGPDALPQPWSKLAGSNAGLLDAIASPSGKLMLLVTATGIELKSEGKILGRLDEQNSVVVMVQWALGKNAARWKAEVAKLFAEEQASAQTP